MFNVEWLEKASVSEAEMGCIGFYDEIMEPHAEHAGKQRERPYHLNIDLIWFSAARGASMPNEEIRMWCISQISSD